MTTAPTCSIAACPGPVRLTNGREIYPHRADLFAKPIWKCDGCGGYVGCHPETTTALGTPAGPELRRAREALHKERIDPLWRRADSCGAYTPEDDKARDKIRKSARRRVYAYLADKLSLTPDQMHVAMLDLATCRRAWQALANITYLDVRAWSRETGGGVR